MQKRHRNNMSFSTLTYDADVSSSLDIRHFGKLTVTKVYNYEKKMSYKL